MAECGHACLAMVASYYGLKIDLNGLRSRHDLSQRGATLAGLIGAADCLDLAARPLRVSLDELV